MTIRQFIYYPLMEFDDSQIKINLTTTETEKEKKEKEKTTEDKISKISNSNNFDNYLHISPIKLPKNCKNISKDWLIYQILALARYRIDLRQFCWSTSRLFE